jgi:hypothetical protein
LPPSTRTMTALMRMKKLDIAEIRRAAAGVPAAARA